MICPRCNEEMEHKTVYEDRVRIGSFGKSYEFGPYTIHQCGNCGYEVT